VFGRIKDRRAWEFPELGAAREAWDKRMPGTKWDKSQTEWETDDPI